MGGGTGPGTILYLYDYASNVHGTASHILFCMLNIDNNNIHINFASQAGILAKKIAKNQTSGNDSMLYSYGR